MTGVVTVIKRTSENGKIRQDGTVDKGGYFFIKDSEGHDRFAHARDLGDQLIFPRLKVGDNVEFKPLSGGPRGNGLRAEEVVVL